ncbi:hypothetical protein B0H63DRAFT_195525 [Podospora didyma]|uniref:Zn(2)-C6 fungal-type domain-containing protein n=1 Tax=Podospora didyma TaxID=330526 RepID=A0AAE0NGD1_9PEZI|nr:hypothetical protein B0H63DRAFT_195525 [Podospora didyma]
MAKLRTGRGRSAGWGAACAPCAAAKARCVGRQSPRARCDRCVSLDEDCSDQVPRPRKKRPAKASRPVPASTDFQTPETPSREDIDSGSSSSPPTCSCAASPPRREGAFPIDSDETLLSIYTNQLFPQFPFVVIPDGTTPEQMQADRPALMKAIRAVASVRHLQSMRGQIGATIQHISHAMFTKFERSLDLLQGILVLLGYYHYFCMSHAHFNNLLHLAFSLVGDMDLNTCPVAQKCGNQLPLMRTEEPKARTKEEKRTLAGVWYVGSNAALVANLLGPVRYTAYLDQSLKELEVAAEYETDQLVVQLVRIQHLTDKILHFHGSDDELPADELHEIPKTPAVVVCVETFQMQLDKLRNTLSSNLKHDYVLSCHYHGAYLRLFEPPLAKAHLNNSFASSPDYSILPDAFARFTAALRAWFADWLALPVCIYFYMPQPVVSTQLIHAAMMLTRWSKIAGPGAFNLAATATATAAPSWKEDDATPAFSGVQSCPDLSSAPPQQPPATTEAACAPPAEVDSAHQTPLNAPLRTRVLAREPGLWLDVFGILDTMAVRFEAAKKEMTIAQGRPWENDTWDLAAKQIKIKKSKIEKWCRIVVAASAAVAASSSRGGEEKNRTTPRVPRVVVADANAAAAANNVLERPGSGDMDAINTIPAEQRSSSIAGLGLGGPMISGGDDDGQELSMMQWESDLFDGIMMDQFDLGGILDTWGTTSWDTTDALDQMGSTTG